MSGKPKVDSIERSEQAAAELRSLLGEVKDAKKALTQLLRDIREAAHKSVHDWLETAAQREIDHLQPAMHASLTAGIEDIRKQLLIEANRAIAELFTEFINQKSTRSDQFSIADVIRAKRLIDIAFEGNPKGTPIVFGHAAWLDPE